MRLGTLHEQTLEDPTRALAYYRDALGIRARRERPAPGGRRDRPLSPDRWSGGKIPPADRVAAARLVLPHLEASRNVGLQAVATR